MRCLVRTIATQKDTLEYRDAEYVAGDITIGSASDSTVHIEGRGVLPIHAQISQKRDGSLQIKASSGAGFTLNDKAQRTGGLTVGDRFSIGPHQFDVISAPHGFDIALAVTSAGAEQPSDVLEFTPGPMSLQEAGWGRRRWAWLLMLLVMMTGLVLPLSWSLWSDKDSRPGWWPVTDNVWLSGPLHFVHRIPGLVDDCSACHQSGFVTVQDTACKACHKTPDHVGQTDAAVLFSNLTCAGCHREHNEPDMLVRKDEALCVNCHGNLGSHGQQTSRLRDMADFNSHPPFKLSMLTLQETRWKLERVPQEQTGLQEHSNLKFSHAQHMDPNGIDGPNGNAVLDCGDCHQPQQDGKLMQPITMEKHCVGCHSLAFEPTDPARQVPHGKPEKVLEDLEGYYARLYAIQGGPVESVHELSRPAQRPGKPPKSFYAAMKAWADDRAFEAATTLLEESACHSCHEVTIDRHQTTAARWHITPVQLNTVWMPLARFDHAGHTQIECKECHKAAQSEQPTDVLMPDLASCKQCHGGEGSSMKVATGCVGCHGYHQSGAVHASVFGKKHQDNSDEKQTPTHE